ncbi:MAG: DUF378 domain-containing protein [Oscillospiraceae bacterium]|jgi:uncharacterized membrane protein YuzA (DUF378 family)|nr:DUF378 domain-containing protein [Oscillospiraceae bacterium]
MLDRIALFLLLLSGLNWGLVGLFRFDAISWAFGGNTAVFSRVLYTLFALSAIWCVSLFFRRNEIIERDRLE